jgi:hypothetical protein
MPVVNRAADYDVDLSEFHDLAEVFEGLRHGPLLLGLDQLTVVNVANGDHFAVVYRCLGDAAPSATAAHERDSKAIIRQFWFGKGTSGQGFFEIPTGEGSGCGSDSCGLDKFSTIHSISRGCGRWESKLEIR